MKIVRYRRWSTRSTNRLEKEQYSRLKAQYSTVQYEYSYRIRSVVNSVVSVNYHQYIHIHTRTEKGDDRSKPCTVTVYTGTSQCIPYASNTGSCIVVYRYYIPYRSKGNEYQYSALPLRCHSHSLADTIPFQIPLLVLLSVVVVVVVVVVTGVEYLNASFV